MSADLLVKLRGKDSPIYLIFLAKNSSKFSMLRTGCIGIISQYNESQSQQHTTWLGFVQTKLQAASAKCFI